MSIKEYFTGNYCNLELIKKENSSEVGGNLLTVREVAIEERFLGIPIFSQKISYYWNPLKIHILRQHVTSKEWGSQDDNYTSMWLRLQNPIVEDVQFYPDTVRIHKNFKCNEDIIKKLTELNRKSHGK